MKVNRKFRKLKKLPTTDLPVTYERVNEGWFKTLEPISGEEHLIDEKYVFASLQEPLKITLIPGQVLELVKYNEGEMVHNHNDKSKQIYCSPDALSLYEWILGNIIAHEQFGYEVHPLMSLAVAYFQLHYPVEYKVVFDGVITVVNPKI